MESKQGYAYDPCLVGPPPSDPSWNPDGHMRANIQDNENAPAFMCDKCHIYHRCFDVIEETGILHLETRCGGHVDAMNTWSCRPNRCLPCARELKRWQRGKNYQRRLLLKFQRERHHHIRMIGIGWLGVRTIQTDEVDKAIRSARSEMVEGLRALRKKPFWKKYCDGGYWFFECTTEQITDDQMHINPHMHLVVLCPKIFPYRKMNDYLDELRWKNSGGATAKLGHCFINHSRNKDGTIKKSKPQDAVNYCVNYVRKDNQFDGKNRGPFGIVLRKSKMDPQPPPA